MKKTFKHRKTGEIATYEDGVLKSSGFCVEIGVEPSSEFWEEVIEKDFEILSLHPNNNYTGVYQILTDKENIDSWMHPSGRGNWEIHSIRRLNDREVFTVGDKINYIKDDIPSGVKIRSFEIHGNKIYINSHYNAAHLLERNLSNWKKHNCLFTTEDGYEIFLGDEYCAVTQNFTLFKHKAMKYSGKNESILKYFKEKTNAELYIFENKPLLSYNDVWYKLGRGGNDINVIVDQEELKRLVKSKL